MKAQFPLVILTFALATAAASNAAAVREFEDKFGRTIKAELLGHWGVGTGYLKIRRDTGQRLTVRLGDFAEVEQPSIRRWIEGTPDALVPFEAPTRIAESVVSGSRWFHIRSDGSRSLVEFGGSGLMKINGANADGARWREVNGKDVAFHLPRGRSHAFSIPVIGNRIYRDQMSNSILVRLDRRPTKLTEAAVAGHSYVLVHPTSVAAFSDTLGQKRAVVDLLKGGKARIGSAESKWKIEAGVLLLRDLKGKWHTLSACSADVSISKRGLILWQITKPGRGTRA